ncbi:hypothetical protein ACT4UM_19155, partial [Bacillus sp. SS-TM]
GAGAAKIVVIILMTWLIALGDTTHIVVGSVEILYLVFNGTLHWSDFIWPFALPTLAGNIQTIVAISQPEMIALANISLGVFFITSMPILTNASRVSSLKIGIYSNAQAASYWRISVIPLVLLSSLWPASNYLPKTP